MTAKIQHVTNGWALQLEDGTANSPIFVCEEPEVEGGEVDCFRNLLWLLNEQLGPSTTKHDAKRIVIDIQPGSDYMGGS